MKIRRKLISNKPQYEWVENAKLFLSRISPKISFGTDPMTDFSISLELNPKSDDINDILQLPEKIAQEKGCRIVICIDEFQQIAEFSDSKTFQKRLRTVWQLQKNVSYCLFGSKKHLMNELFEKNPFLSTSLVMQSIYKRYQLPIGLNISVADLRLLAKVFPRNSPRGYAPLLIITLHTFNNLLGSFG